MWSLRQTAIPCSSKLRQEPEGPVFQLHTRFRRADTLAICMLQELCTAGRSALPKRPGVNRRYSPSGFAVEISERFSKACAEPLLLRRFESQNALATGTGFERHPRTPRYAALQHASACLGSRLRHSDSVSDTHRECER